MTPRAPHALRASLDARLGAIAAERRTDVNRLRRHLTFQRLLRRLMADGSWVLKGGYLLEARFGLRARATRDLDLAAIASVDDLADAVAEALMDDVDGDGFVFRITGVRDHRLDSQEAGGPGVHLSISADLAGRPFAAIRLDVVSRPEEIDGGVEQVTLPILIAEPGWVPVVIPAVDLAQHIAEKMHALTAVYAHPRPSTRVKDLLDVVLVADSGTLDDVALGDRLRAVFAARDGSAPPSSIPEPPAAWDAEYSSLADQHGVSASTLAAALVVAREQYARALGAPSRAARW